MKSLKVTPGAKRLIGSLRNLGYECSTAIADLVDNSIAAGASEIHVEIQAQQGDRPPAIVIADNGRGMDREQLYEAMRFGASQDYSADDLGKFGLGLKTASLSQCATLTVSSKAKGTKDTRPRRHYARWDVAHVNDTDDWDLLAPTPDELDSWECDALEHEAAQERGTVVLWTSLEEPLALLSAHDVRERERFLARLIDEVSAHLRTVFHRFMQGSVTGRRKLNVHVCGKQLEPWDPFCRAEKTAELDILTLGVSSPDADKSKGTDRVAFSPFILPREDEFSSPAAFKSAGAKKWNQLQGFYFYRNNRLLQSGGWSWMRAVDEHTKLLRIAVDFSRDLDRAFAINITKMRARIPADIRDRVANEVTTWAKKARHRYDHETAGSKTAPKRSAPARTQPPDAVPPAIQVGSVTFLQSNMPAPNLTVVDQGFAGRIKVLIPRNHELASVFTSRNGDGSEMRQLCLQALTILEAVYEGRIKAKQIPIAALKKALQRCP